MTNDNQPDAPFPQGDPPTVSNGPDGGRDAGGRFSKGNRFGRGSPHLARLAAAQAEARAAAEPGRVRAVLDALYERATAFFDVAAASAWLTRVLGKPREATPEPIGFDLPTDLSTTAGIAAACQRVVAAVAAGEIDAAAGERLLGMLTATATATAWRDVASRLDAIERALPIRR